MVYYLLNIEKTGVFVKPIYYLFFATLPLFSDSLEELVSYATKKSTIIQLSQSEVALAKLKRKESSANRFGELNAMGSFTHYNIERTLAPLTPSVIGAGTPITTSKDIFSPGLSYSVALFTGFAQTREVEIDEIASSMADVKMKLTKEQLIYNIRTLYLSILSQQEIRKAQKAYQSALEKLTKQIAYEVKLGKKALIDLLKSKADLSAAKTKVQMSDSVIETLLATLSSIVGKEVTTLEPLEVVVEKGDYHISELFNIALSTGRMQMESLGVKKAEKMIAKSKSSRYPQINLSSYIGKNYGKDIKTDDIDDETLWQVGLNGKFNLIDFGKRSANIERAKIAKIKATLHKEQTLLDIKKELIDAVGKIRSSYSTYYGNQHAWDLSQKSEKIEQVRYKHAASTLNDLLLAKSKTLLVAAKVIESKYAYQKSIYYLDYILERGVEDEN
jgi:outer membrane protein TolC